MVTRLTDSVEENGKYGEDMARRFLKTLGYSLIRPDYMGERNGNWVCIEVKYLERFEPPPFYGHGLGLYQNQARLKFQEQTGIKTIVLIIEKPSLEIYWQWLEVLNKGKFYDTVNGIRIFPIENYFSLELNK